MNFFYAIGRNTSRFFQSIALFFAFIGHVIYSANHALFGRSQIAWINVLKVLYNSGTAIAIPLIIISIILANSLGLNTHSLLKHFNLQGKTLPITLNALVRNLLPIMIGFVLCVQSALNLIIARTRITKLRHTPHEVVLNYILPILIGINMTAVVLYAYTLAACLISLFYIFHYYFNLSQHEYMIHITHSIMITDLTVGIVKTLILGTILSLTAGYYYYEAAIVHVPLRTAVSRILTRGAVWIAVVSALLRTLSF